MCTINRPKQRKIKSKEMYVEELGRRCVAILLGGKNNRISTKHL